jgi:hypothetical protein
MARAAVGGSRHYRFMAIESCEESAALRAEVKRLRLLVEALVPFLIDDVRAGLEVGPAPAGHSCATETCDDCAWFEASLLWQKRIDAGELS